MPSLDSALRRHGYTQIRKVGEGSFGQAILVEHESDRGRDSKAIIKLIDISRATTKERDDALTESQVLRSLKHPYIVRYRETFLEAGWLCISMDYCEGGDLAEKVKRVRADGSGFPEEQVVRWLTQALLALKHIHAKHILHRDLKSANFFLSRRQNLKMGDFGIAKVLECTAANAQTQIGTPYYLSPEICLGRPYSWTSDIWAMGCILHEICALRVPFDAPDLKSLIKVITEGAIPDLPAEYSEALRDLSRDMLCRDAAQRPEAAAVLRRPLVQQVVKDMLEEVRGEEERPSSRGPAPPRPPVEPRGAAGDYAGAAGSYANNDEVEYLSPTHGEWLPAIVTGVQADGRVMINLKPNSWLSLEVQAQKLRMRLPEAPVDPGGPRRPPSAPLGRPPVPAAVGTREASPAPRAQAGPGSARGAAPPAAAARERTPNPGGGRAPSRGRDPHPRERSAERFGSGQGYRRPSASPRRR